MAVNPRIACMGALLLAASPIVAVAQTNETPQSAAERLLAGDGRFQFDGWAGPAIQVWTHVPAAVEASTPVVIVMHGRGRDADRYLAEWRDLAEQHRFILAVPEFDAERFPRANAYNHGHFRTQDGASRPRETWTFSAIEPLFDAVKQRTGSQVEGYGLYGHSAGAQFVHRFALLMPEARYRVAVSANAGSYAFPDLEIDYPFGLHGAPVDEADLKAALQRPLTILLGTADTDPNHASLPRGARADRQGEHRLARGEAFFEAGRAAAARLGVPFGWRIAHAPGVAHQNGGMAQTAAPILAGATE